MNAIKPLTRAVAEAPKSVVADFVEARLSSVTYHYLPSAAGPAFAGGNEGVDSDVTAVVLDLGERGHRTVTWAMNGELEGLSILGDDVSYEGQADQVIGVDKRQAWIGAIGERIESVGVAWQISGDGCPETLWAMRLDFPSRSVVIALGTADEEVDYMPDELVIVFDSELARAYRPPHVSESAWGREFRSAI